MIAFLLIKCACMSSQRMPLPGHPGWRASLAARMPAEMDEVLVEVLAARIQNLVARRRPISPETAAFWSAAVGKE